MKGSKPLGTECIDTRKLKTIVSVSSFLQVAFHKELVAADRLVHMCWKRVGKKGLRREKASDS